MKTNKEIAKKYKITPRQVSKGKKRGWIWQDGIKVKFKIKKTN